MMMKKIIIASFLVCSAVSVNAMSVLMMAQRNISIINKRINELNSNYQNKFNNLSSQIKTIQGTLNQFKTNQENKNNSINSNYQSLGDQITTLQNSLNVLKSDENGKNRDNKIAALEKILNQLKSDTENKNNSVDNSYKNLSSQIKVSSEKGKNRDDEIEGLGEVINHLKREMDQKGRNVHSAYAGVMRRVTTMQGDLKALMKNGIENEVNAETIHQELADKIKVLEKKKHESNDEKVEELSHEITTLKNNFHDFRKEVKEGLLDISTNMTSIKSLLEKDVSSKK